MSSFVTAFWSGERRRDRLARAVLLPFSWLYATGVRLRNRLYDEGVLRSARVGVPVVCVGNIVVGGTGKTPFVMWLVERLNESGLRAVVVSRGYGKRSRRPTVVTSKPLEAPLQVAALAGGRARLVVLSDSDERSVDGVADEALLVATRCGVPVVSHRDRVRAAALAASLRPDLIVLDDGFQHRRLHRAVDVVLVDDLSRSARLLPAGPARENSDALTRADFVVTRSAPSPSGMVLRATPHSLVPSVAAECGEGLERLCGARVLAVAGIARPERLRQMLLQLGAATVEMVAYDDHHTYLAKDCAKIAAAGAGHDLVVTTEKDLVKLERMRGFDDRLRALRLLIRVEGAESLLSKIEALARVDASDRRTHHRGSSGLGGGSKAV